MDTYTYIGNFFYFHATAIDQSSRDYNKVIFYKVKRNNVDEKIYCNNQTLLDHTIKLINSFGLTFILSRRF